MNGQKADGGPAPANRKRCCGVLVVEDDADIRTVLCELLKLDGYESVEAENGRVALERLKGSKRPCLILLDLMMPVLNGQQFIEALRKDDQLATIPVVVVSAFADQANQLKDKTAGFVRKPVDLRVLMQFVREHCGWSTTSE